MMKPGFCCFGIIDECFLRCKMCRKWLPDAAIAGVARPAVEQWKRAIGSIASIAEEGFLINFGGGEPLLYKPLLELVSCAAGHNFRTNIATNAYLIDSEMAKRIGDSGLSSVNISLDSTKEQTHDYLRGVDGVYRRAMSAIELLDKYAPKELEIIICSAIYDINMDEVIGIAEWVNAHPRIKWVYFMAAMQPNNSGSNPDWQKGEFKYLWPQNKARISQVIDGLIRLKNNGYKINNQFCQLRAFKEYFNAPELFVKDGSCNLDRALHISSVGNIYLCYEWGSLGNIAGSDVAEVWHSPQAAKIRQDIRACKKNCHHLINCFFEGEGPLKELIGLSKAARRFLSGHYEAGS